MSISNDRITLQEGDFAVTLDPFRGAEILSISLNGSEVMWTSPWADRAESILRGAPSVATDSLSRYLEGYRGGWQTLCPNAGAARSVHGAPVGFHGEVALSAWDVKSSTTTRAELSLTLVTLPIRIDRTITISNDAVTQHDTLTNLSDEPLSFDYSQHPSFGGALLDGECFIETQATTFVSDPQTPSAVPEGARVSWPIANGHNGELVDLAEVPEPGVRRLVFGWLEGFSNGSYSITNISSGLSVTCEWDARQLPFAWVWEELNFSSGYPWFKRARVLAIEPASTTTSGSGRETTFALAPGASESLSITVSVEVRDSPIRIRAERILAESR